MELVGSSGRPFQAPDQPGCSIDVCSIDACSVPAGSLHCNTLHSSSSHSSSLHTWGPDYWAASPWALFSTVTWLLPGLSVVVTVPGGSLMESCSLPDAALSSDNHPNVLSRIPAESLKSGPTMESVGSGGGFRLLPGSSRSGGWRTGARPGHPVAVRCRWSAASEPPGAIPGSPRPPRVSQARGRRGIRSS